MTWRSFFPHKFTTNLGISTYPANTTPHQFHEDLKAKSPQYILASLLLPPPPPAQHGGAIGDAWDTRGPQRLGHLISHELREPQHAPLRQPRQDPHHLEPDPRRHALRLSQTKFTRALSHRLRLRMSLPLQRIQKAIVLTSSVGKVISSDGAYALSASWDKTLRLWELATGVTTRRFVGHTNDVLSVSFSADNRQIVSGSRDRTIKLWNTLGDCKFTITDKGHTEWVSCVRFSPNPQNPVIVSAGWDKLVKVCMLFSFFWGEERGRSEDALQSTSICYFRAFEP